MGAMSDSRQRLLGPWGWDAFFESQWETLGNDDWVPARVTGEQKGMVRLQLGQLSLLGEVSGKFRHEAKTDWEWPSTGDWVAVTPRPSDGRATIHLILERKTCLHRKAAGENQDIQILASNVDTAFIVTSLNHDLNPRRVERYLTLIRDSGAVPVVLLTKSDLVEDPQTGIDSIATVAAGVDVLAISAKASTGIEALQAHLLPGKTLVLLGSSGVGKSTLANRLLGEEVLKTQAAREGDDRGRHTTTARHLFQLPTGALLIDTPGMRELQLGEHEEGLDSQFEDIASLGDGCRFGNCGHASEPGCAVRAALENGSLSRERWDAFTKLQREMRFHQTKDDKAATSENKKHWKSVNVALRKHLKDKRPK